MEIWSYEEANEIVRENFNQSLALGLNIVQSVERALYEFETVMEENEIEKLMIYIILTKLGVEHNEVRPDICDEFFRLTETHTLLQILNQFDNTELNIVKKEIDELRRRLLKEI
ncbi:hypothetical protein A3844_30200 [Paenibacillus helianthi]|uniref:Uncharacterized protein n=1 Tax=Paenibacillus helianthi TaxID=1349432 RepID=A0ABX3EES9_9BACL|nr:hypothetical protein [Paenibacillus helianthi]OKP76544.1 hypothetical protein A3844_30200 [Paenibacillus helianthi]